MYSCVCLYIYNTRYDVQYDDDDDDDDYTKSEYTRAKCEYSSKDTQAIFSFFFLKKKTKRKNQQQKEDIYTHFSPIKFSDGGGAAKFSRNLRMCLFCYCCWSYSSSFLSPFCEYVYMGVLYDMNAVFVFVVIVVCYCYGMFVSSCKKEERKTKIMNIYIEFRLCRIFVIPFWEFICFLLTFFSLSLFLLQILASFLLFWSQFVCV